MIHPYDPKDQPAFPLGQCPMVKTIDITGVDNTPDAAFNLPSLTSLNVQRSYGLPTLETLAAVLKAAPSLEVLGLGRRQGNGDYRHKTAAELLASDKSLPVRLPPQLKSVELITSDPTFSSEILSLLSFPPTAQISLCVPVRFHWDIPMDFFSNALPSQNHLRNIGSLSQIDSLGVHVFRENIQVSMAEHGNVLLSIDLLAESSSGSEQIVVDAFVFLIQHLGIGHQIRSLVLTDAEEHWVGFDKLFRLLPNLSSLGIRAPFVGVITCALADDGPEVPESEQQSRREEERQEPIAVFPHLSHIYLHKIEFDYGVSVFNLREREDDYMTKLETVAETVKYDPDRSFF